MTLSTGTKLSHYEITSQIGKGGMGEVYQARDTKLGRDVAIKVLPEEFAQDADRVARFQREAKLLASLNHPNIAAIYGLEESDGTNFLVMELVEGNTLDDRIKSGPIPVEEALKLALQIAEALEAAHEKGVIHRDLKPANIKVTPDRKVKVLDFGLAKAFAGEQADLNLSNSPTLSVAATQQGVILGTAAYMSPEQARGKEVDKRADIWAFGVVLFEMLTGKSLFSGADVSSTLAKVLEREPDYSALPPNLHPRIRLLLERCLEKDSKDRYGVISDARVDIQKVLDDPSGVFAQPVSATEYKPRFQQILPWIAAATALTAVVIGFAVWILKPTPPPEPRPVWRFEYDLPEGQALLPSSEVAISKDGKIAYVTSEGSLYLKDTLELNARLIQGADDNPLSPFFSPDGKWIGYWSRDDSQLKKIAITGDTPVKICDVDIVTAGASWGADDMIVFSGRGGILQVSADGGTPEEIVKAENEMLSNAQILPDGKSVLFCVVSGIGTEEVTSQVVVQSLESEERKELFEGNNAQYLSTGHLVYTLGDDNLYAIAFDLDRLEPIGGPVPMVDGIFRIIAPLPPLLAISDSGTLVYIPGRKTAEPSLGPQMTLVWVDSQGKEEPIDAKPGYYTLPEISPDGTKVALTVTTPGNQGIIQDFNQDIWIYDLIRKNLARLTRNGSSRKPLWTPDGQRIVFMLGNRDKISIYRRAADGTGEDELLGSMPDGILIPASWSKDGKILITGYRPTRAGARSGARPSAMVSNGRGNRGDRAGSPPWISFEDIGLLSMEGNHEWKPLLQEDYVERYPQISPHGRWIAYMSNESEKEEVYLQPFPDVDKGKEQVSTDGGAAPLWSPDERELFYRGPDKIMAVSVETEPTLKLGAPKALFPDKYVEGWDISPDGKRFLMLKNVETAENESQAKRPIFEGPRKIIVVTNWFEELKELAPAD